MTISGTLRNGGANAHKLLVIVLFVAGFALVGSGAYMHFTIGDRTLGHCAVCDPWHPMWVIAPLVVGTAVVLFAGYLAYQQ